MRFGSVLLLVVAPLAGCVSAATLDSFDRDRDADMARIHALPPLDRALQLRDRVLRDGLVAKYPATFGFGSRSDFAAMKDLRYVRMWGPVREKVGEDYVLLGDALREGDDVDGAVTAYEDAIAVAEAYVPNAEGAARIRASALRGEEQLWRGRKEEGRSALARAMALAEEAWLRGPDADRARHEWNALLAESHAASERHLAPSAPFPTSPTLDATNEAMLKRQENVAALRRSAKAWGAVAANGRLTAPFLTAIQKQAADTIAAVRDAKEGAPLTPLRDVVKGDGNVVAAIDSGQLAAFGETTEGKVMLGGVYRALVDYRRGDDPNHLVAELAAMAQRARIGGGSPAPPAPAPTAVPKTNDALDARLRKLKDLYDGKTITKDEYERERARLLKEGL